MSFMPTSFNDDLSSSDLINLIKKYVDKKPEVKMIKKIVIRSNGDIHLISDDTTAIIKTLDALVEKLLAEKKIDGDTEIHTCLNHQPTLVKEWYDLKPSE